MGIFGDDFGMPGDSGWGAGPSVTPPGDGGWGAGTSVTPGEGSLAERIRFALTGQAAASPQMANAGQAVGKMIGAAAGGPSKSQQQQTQGAPAAPTVPAKLGANPLPPFVGVSAAQPQRRPPIYAPFAGTGPVG